MRIARDRERLIAIDRLLRKAHAPSRLGNVREPLAELIFIVLSVQTEEYNYLRTYRELRRRFPGWSSVLSAGAEKVYDAIKLGGLGRKKALQIVSLLRELKRLHGRPALLGLRRMTDEEVERVLTRLPGVGLKTARCVMLYSLDRDVFPVDTHVWRMLRRLDLVEGTDKPSLRQQRLLQERVPPRMRRRLHINLVLHGRQVCTSARPRCDVCPLADLCPSRRALTA